jgi:hypothetical protein
VPMDRLFLTLIVANVLLFASASLLVYQSGTPDLAAIERATAAPVGKR